VYAAPAAREGAGAEGLPATDGAFCTGTLSLLPQACLLITLHATYLDEPFDVEDIAAADDAVRQIADLGRTLVGMLPTARCSMKSDNSRGNAAASPAHHSSVSALFHLSLLTMLCHQRTSPPLLSAALCYLTRRCCWLHALPTHLLGTPSHAPHTPPLLLAIGRQRLSAGSWLGRQARALPRANKRAELGIGGRHLNQNSAYWLSALATTHCCADNIIYCIYLWRAARRRRGRAANAAGSAYEHRLGTRHERLTRRNEQYKPTAFTAPPSLAATRTAPRGTPRQRLARAACTTPCCPANICLLTHCCLCLALPLPAPARVTAPHPIAIVLFALRQSISPAFRPSPVLRTRIHAARTSGTSLATPSLICAPALASDDTVYNCAAPRRLTRAGLLYSAAHHLPLGAFSRDMTSTSRLLDVHFAVYCAGGADTAPLP